MSERTVVIAATNVLARGFQTVPTDRLGALGQPVNALYAVAGAVLRAFAFKTPTRAVALVDPTPRSSWPALLSGQLPALIPLLNAMGLEVIESEAEFHLAASYVHAAREAGDDVVVVGMDKRLAQLVEEGSVWWYDPAKEARYTRDMVVKRFGVPPEQVADWLALVGNKDDGLPGISGIGAKGATSLLAEQGSVAHALANLDALSGRIGKALQLDPAKVTTELAHARLDRHRPLPQPLVSLPFQPPDPEAVNGLFRSLGFVEYLSSADAAQVEVMLCTSEPEVGAALAALRLGLTALHGVTEDPSPVRGALIGVALSQGDSKALFIPLLEPEQVPPSLVAWLEDSRAPKLAHDLTEISAPLLRRGIRLAGALADSGVASHLTQPSNWAPHDLGTVAKQVLGRALPSEDALRGTGLQRQQWSALDLKVQARWAGEHAEAAHQIWLKLESTVDRALLAEYLELGEALVAMELRGIGVDRAELARAEEAIGPIEDQLESEITALAGKPFNLNSSKQLGEVLFAELKLPIVSRTKTGWSTATEALERISQAHPIVPRVIRWRTLRRMRDSWITALATHIDGDSRVRSEFHHARSFSGHILSNNPDLARVPGRTPEMQRIRRAFVARPGHLLMSVDYNQLGLHVLAHLTHDPALVEPLKLHADIHAQTAAAVLERPLEAIGPDERQLGKVINFATFAGQGSSALALQLGVSPAEAKAMIARFDRRYSKVRGFQDEQLRLVRERGYVVTLAGRHWPIGGLESLDPQDRSYAERLARRATHEGSVADVARRGLLEAHRALRREGLAAAPLVQVIDEVLFEVPIDEVKIAAPIAAEAMRHAFQLEAPLQVGIWLGPNWADLEEKAI